MALLVYSDNCNYCMETITYIKTQPTLLQILRFHNISTNGVPSPQIKRVPSLVTNEGKMYVGAEVRGWLESMIPEDITSFSVNNFSITNLEDNDDDGNFFSLDMYGVPLQPVVTPELSKKISKNVTEGINKSR
jgi:hypothetical protein